MKKPEIIALDDCTPDDHQAATRLLATAFNDPERYSEARLHEALKSDTSPYYRQFFAARIDQQIVGVAGIKAADWASNTHILYLSAVAPAYRGKGVGRMLIKARLDWLESNFESGRILVSTGKPRRFRHFGFSEIPFSIQQGKRLMIRRF